MISLEYEITKYLSFEWKHRYYKLRSIFIPQNQTVRKAIPRTYIDPVNLLEETAFACLISWVEDEDGLFPQMELIENGLANIDDAEYIDQHWFEKSHLESYAKRLPDYKKLEEIYLYVKNNLKNDREDYENDDKVTEKITNYLVDLVKLRGYLWT
jgi:hypothetical protein